MVEARFELRSHEFRSKLQSHVVGLSAVLRGAQAYAGVNEVITPQAWQHLRDTLRIEENYPGFSDLIYLRVVRGDELADMTRGQTMLSGREFVVRPPGQRDFYVLVANVAPVTERNAVALGSDSWSSPVRREAFERARDSGNPAVSAQDPARHRPGTGAGLPDLPGALQLRPPAGQPGGKARAVVRLRRHQRALQRTAG